MSRIPAFASLCLCLLFSSAINHAASSDTAFLIVNEYLADPPDGATGDANGDGRRDSAQDEFVEICNTTAAPVNVGGFTVSDSSQVRFTFPPGTEVPAGEVAVIFGGGLPAGEFGNAGPGGLVFTAALSLNNTGDSIIIKDAAGNIIESVTFGAAQGNANQSINRNPDASASGFAPHAAIAGSEGRLFSPGARVNGSPFTRAPRLSGIAPESVEAGDAPFMLSIQGSGFDSISMALIDSTPVDTTQVSESDLVAAVPAAIASTPGAYTIRVRNEGGRRSNAIVLRIIPPPPLLRFIQPAIAVSGTGSLALLANGASFDSSPTVLVDGSPVATIRLTARELRASLPASLISSPASRRIRVRNRDGQQSNELALEVIAPGPRIHSISPVQTLAGGPGVRLTITGSNFSESSEAAFAQTRLATQFIKTTELQADVPPSLIKEVGLQPIAVYDGAVQASNEALFRVVAVAPLIRSVEPGTIVEGAGELRIAILGERFQPNARVRIVERFGPSLRLGAAFITSERIEASLPASLSERAGKILLDVENSDFGLSNSAAIDVLIRDPLVINEYLADPPDGVAGDANGDGARSSSADEFVEIVNRSREPVDISGYRLSDGQSIRHVFAPGTLVPPLEAAVVFGGGEPAGRFGNAGENRLVFKASAGSLSLNNGGGSIRLEDAEGGVIQEIKFGSVEGGANVSLNRDPDADGPVFTLHTRLSDSGLLFSPGAKASGEPFTLKPRILALTPARTRKGSGDLLLTVSGSNLLPGAEVLLGEAVLDTTYRSSQELEATAGAPLLEEGGKLYVRVRNPKGELSEKASFVVFDDPPLIASLSPQEAGTNASGIEVTIEGERFQRGAMLQIAGESIEARLRMDGAARLVALIPEHFFLRAARLEVRVLNADGNPSNGAIFTVENGPLITRLSRSRIRVGSPDVEMAIGGLAFKRGVVLLADGDPVRTLFLSETAIAARIPAEKLAFPGSLTIQARNLDGGRSNRLTIRVVE